MKALIIVAIFGYLFLSCDKMECVEHDCNGAVPQYYQPVCGCNNITYINPEAAECHGIIQYHYGECDE